MKKLLLSCIALVFALIGNGYAGANSCTSYASIGDLGGCSGAGAYTILGFLTCDASIMSASATYRGAGDTNSFVP